MVFLTGKFFSLDSHTQDILSEMQEFTLGISSKNTSVFVM